jgi:RNase P subunit RPR2
MASTTTERMNKQGKKDLPLPSTKALLNQVCVRCGGLLVSHICMDVRNSGSELDIAALRCVQCGDIVDSVILRNRRIAHESPTAPPAETPRSFGEIQIGA